jgi:glycosyltransferase involved in cell wall biosynthesis
MNINSASIQNPNRIAVVMATCNGAAFIEQQLHSLLQQTLQPDLIIIRDDASEDTTFEILTRFANQPGFNISQNLQRLGVNENFAKAVADVPDGYLIAFCDQDDYWLPEKLEKSVQLLNSLTTDSTQPAMVYSDLMLMNETGELIHTSVHQQRGQHRYSHVWNTFLFGNMVSGCTIVMNPAMKSIMAALPPQGGFIYDAWLAMAAFGFGKIAKLPQPYIHYRQHTQNVTFADHRAHNRMERWINHWQNSWKVNRYLQEEIQLAKAFYSMYANRLTVDKRKSLENLIALNNCHYLKKKAGFEMSFRNYWTNRFGG